MSSAWLGIIADDVTGATDVAGYLVREGTSTVQYLGVPDQELAVDADCLVIALRTRSVPAEDAVAESLRALEWLLAAGVEQVFFKYCSTFDSTPAGNIGPVADALADRLGVDRVIFCPSAPENYRTVYHGKLFVGEELLEESPLKDHPINPMRDSDLPRLIRAQSARPVRLVDLQTLQAGGLAESIDLAPGGLVVDAITDEDLDLIAAEAARMRFSTGAAGLAAALGRAHSSTSVPAPPVIPGGPAAIISGSCSAATRGQVAEFLKDHAGYLVDPLRVAAGDDVLGEAVAFVAEELSVGTPLVYSTADPAEVERVQAALGADAAGRLTEQTLASIAAALPGLGVRRLVVAGGETSGAVAAAIGASGLRIGAEVDPGVPWTVTIGNEPMALLLKSGNFGSADFFSKALDR